MYLQLLLKLIHNLNKKLFIMKSMLQVPLYHLIYFNYYVCLELILHAYNV